MIQKVQASLYAIGKRLQGYHLLKNPKGTPQTEVNMVKETYGCTKHFDDMFDTVRIKKSFANGEQKEEVRYLTSTHYFDTQKKEMTSPRKKDILYLVTENGKDKTVAVRGDISQKESKTRELPALTKKDFQKKSVSEASRGYYKKRYPLDVKIISLGLYKRIGPPPEDRPNFFKVLYQNLTNKG